jgi:tetratricopeptide (TPR) repeat protein
VTNEHVAHAGKIFVDLGSARVPAKIQSVDAYNDLAILTVDVEITAKPLALADSAPSPGDSVFAIGNPEGLDRSISQGVVSATREIDHRELLQITASISHGSSGGPIVNARGQVVGVAVGFLSSGQSLNFSVPAAKVAALLKNGSPKLDLGLFDQIQSLQAQHQEEAYSEEPDSQWQRTRDEIKSLLQKALDAAGSDDAVLLRLAKVARDSWEPDIGINTSERLLAVKPSSEAHIIFAQFLTQKYTFMKDDAERQKLMSQAEREARLAVNTGRTSSGEAYSVLANVLEDRGSYKEAQSDFRSAFDAAHKANDSALELSSTQGLVRTADALKQFDEAGHLLEGLDREGNATAWSWLSHADVLSRNSMYQLAGNSYRRAAELNGPYSNWCSAATQYSVASQEDDVLFCARKCITGGTGEKGSEDFLGEAHREIATVLNSRSVYTEALNNAKESTVLSPNNAFGYDEMAEALIGLRRFDEAVNAAQQAIRLSDGKFGWMHFHLGSAYFSLENWNFAIQSFEKAAELNPQEPASAYNAALCHSKLRHWGDAVRWYREYLKRSPAADDRSQVLETIRILSQ